MSDIKEIAELRKAIVDKKQVVDGHRRFVELTVEHKNLQQTEENLISLKGELQTAEDAYRVECVTAYNTTDEKDYPGGQVKIYTTLKYDEAQARSWAMVHKHTQLLKLDATAFKKVAKTLKPSFVALIEEPKMTLARDLSEFLEGKDEAIGGIIGNPEQPDITETME